MPTWFRDRRFVGIILLLWMAASGAGLATWAAETGCVNHFRVGAGAIARAAAAAIAMITADDPEAHAADSPDRPPSLVDSTSTERSDATGAGPLEFDRRGSGAAVLAALLAVIAFAIVAPERLPGRVHGLVVRCHSPGLRPGSSTIGQPPTQDLTRQATVTGGGFLVGSLAARRAGEKGGSPRDE